ncbi:Cyclin family protein [Rhynchospora pubera]|uniref:Cyclin family protein n=1 Tax=Rhynchospora pubera TaxID=906938 RepID=A0AAV8EIK0_9POAL|nr:Cyclin family protein [Rhynchospora pubera]
MASRDQNVVSQNQRGGTVRVQSLLPKPQATSKYGERKGRPARPALDNISNLVPAPPTNDGKPINRPITRGFGAKLLANAQTAAAVPGSKKSGSDQAKEVKKQVNLGPAPRKATCVTKPTIKKKESNDQAAQKRVDQRPIAKKTTTVVKTTNVAKAPALTLQKKEGKKVMQNSRSDPSVGKVTVPMKPIRKPEYSRRREVHTLTSVLSARSRVACGIKEKAPKEVQIEDIDEADINNQLAAVEYIEAIYSYYKQVEDTYRPNDYVSRQTDANPRRRTILMDWIIEVHHRFKLRPETLYLTVYIIDRYLSLEENLVPKTELQLVGICAMLIASKYEEIWAPQVDDLIEISNYAYERAAILEKEKQVLNKLDWYLTVPTLYMFLVRFIKAARADKEMENMVYFLAELGLLEHSLIKYSPSMVAASCVYVARCTLGKSPIWTPTLVHHTHYAAPQLCECAQILVNARLAAPHSKLIAVQNKYSHEEFGKVALYQSDISPSSTSTAFASCSSSCGNSS